MSDGEGSMLYDGQLLNALFDYAGAYSNGCFVVMVDKNMVRVGLGRPSMERIGHGDGDIPLKVARTFAEAVAKVIDDPCESNCIIGREEHLLRGGGRDYDAKLLRTARVPAWEPTRG